MELLVLGGTVFLSREVAAEAVRRGHTVTCACRGESGSVPDGARLVGWDRTEPVPDRLEGREFDAVVDVARRPSWVRAAVTAFGGAHWVFVSTISVYADQATPGGGPGATPVHDPEPDDVDLDAHPEAYGPMKVACEQAVLAGTASATVVRPGLIVGPGDETGRFGYWPQRLAEGGQVLAPGDPSDTVQVIDVRDLARWLVDLAETRRTGVYDGVGPVGTLGGLFDQVARAVSPAEPVRLVWASDDDLVAHDVQPWMGPRSLPLWLPRPAYDGMLAHDPVPAHDAGLRTRPIAETARDTLDWLRSTPDAPTTGLTRAEEAAVLAGLPGSAAAVASSP